ncbi:MAG: hypothetical protein HY290_15300 [Planctomycetia bacterium]|nr:hypothetical protein [Planctomycetia bacterium]
MTHRIGMGLVLATVVGLGWSFGQAETKSAAKPQRLPESALMQAKVASSHKVMEGLVAKDFHEIRTGAEELKKICRATEWQAHSDPVYGHHRAELIRQANKLVDSADQSNLDAAAFAYINVLATCIHCHEHCRDVLKIAEIRRPTKVIPIPTNDADDMPPGPATQRR